MEMKQYLIDTFRYNDQANRQVMEKVLNELPDKTACIKFFSHLANCQYKWMARILHDPKTPAMSWWEPVYTTEDLEKEWTKSLQLWISFLEKKTEAELFEDATFVGMDGGQWTAKLKDIALQLNYHSIHHRAQIQSIIRQQGLEPEFVDYIGTVARKLS
jgi:uncharacterized damage-inducible protein DinB